MFWIRRFSNCLSFRKAACPKTLIALPSSRFHSFKPLRRLFLLRNFFSVIRLLPRDRIEPQTGKTPNARRHREQNLPVVVLFRLICSKGWFRLFEINPAMGIKGCTSRLASASTTENPWTSFCLSARGQLQRVWQKRDSQYMAGSLPGNRGKSFMDLRCKFCKNKCCIYLPHVSQTERKGHKERRASARRTGLRNLGFVQKAERVNVHLVVHNILAQRQSVCLLSELIRFESGK